MEAHTLALPFVLKRSEDIVGASKVTSTREVIHGLLRIDATHLVVQWRVSRKTEHVGAVIRTDRELEPVREVAIPLEALRVRRCGSVALRGSGCGRRSCSLHRTFVHSRKWLVRPAFSWIIRPRWCCRFRAATG